MSSYDKNRVEKRPFQHRLINCYGLDRETLKILIYNRHGGQILEADCRKPFPSPHTIAHMMHCTNVHDKLVTALEKVLEDLTPFPGYVVQHIKGEIRKTLTKARGDHKPEETDEQQDKDHTV